MYSTCNIKCMCVSGGRLHQTCSRSGSWCSQYSPAVVCPFPTARLTWRSTRRTSRRCNAMPCSICSLHTIRVLFIPITLLFLALMFAQTERSEIRWDEMISPHHGIRLWSTISVHASSACFCGARRCADWTCNRSHFVNCRTRCALPSRKCYLSTPASALKPLNFLKYRLLAYLLYSSVLVFPAESRIDT